MTNKNKQKNKKKEKKRKKQIIKECNDNIIRKILFWLKPYFNYFIGSYYVLLHYL